MWILYPLSPHKLLQIQILTILCAFIDYIGCMVICLGHAEVVGWVMIIARGMTFFYLTCKDVIIFHVF